VRRSRKVCFSHPKGFYRVPDVAATLDPNRCGKLRCLKSTAFTTVIAGEKCRQEFKTFKIPQSSQFSGFLRGGLH
jgi:hypothetical protein